MISRKFIERVHIAVDELNYDEDSELDYGKFMDSAIYALAHCKELSDAKLAVKMINFCNRKWRKIEKLFSSKSDVFKSYEWEGNSIIEIMPDEDAGGVFYITNGIFRKIKDIMIASSNFDNEPVMFDVEKGRFCIFTDGNYYIKYAMASSYKMKLYDQDKNLVCTIVLSDSQEIFLENNATPYHMVIYDDLVGVYSRDYIDSLSEEDEIDPSKILADIEWDILDKNSDYGVARLTIYEPDLDVEMLLMFATSTFLLYQRYNSRQAMFVGMFTIFNQNRIINERLG